MSRLSIYKWGPNAWNFIHAVSYAYPEQASKAQREEMFKFLWYFARVLPCMQCREDFKTYLQRTLTKREQSSVFATRQSLVHFLVDAHNHVNRKLSKSEWSYARVDALYRRTTGTGTGRPCMLHKFFLLLLALIVMVAIKRGTILRSFRTQSSGLGL